MRHRKHTFKIGLKAGHRRSLVANAVCSLLTHGRITTTVPKAKEIRRIAEKMITLGKRGTLHAHRLAVSRIHQKSVVQRLFNEIAPAYESRNGGYTRLLRTRQRIGDGAELCILELVDYAMIGGEAEVEETAPAEETSAE
jgi:large subunit ribosomal protein L17